MADFDNNKDTSSYCVTQCPSVNLANLLIENAIGYMHIPLGIVNEMSFNDKIVDVYMATEEESVIAACSSAINVLKRHSGKLMVKVPAKNIMIGQIQIVDVLDVVNTIRTLSENKESLKNCCSLTAHVEDIFVHAVANDMIVVYIHVVTGDTMGAWKTIRACELIGNLLSNEFQLKCGLKILTNFAEQMLCISELLLPNCPEELGTFFNNADKLACIDVYRATTHNKGIMNGIAAVLTATGNDTRAVEAGAHAWAATKTIKNGYGPLTRWRYDVKSKILHGRLEIPLQLATKGGIIDKHPTAKFCLKKMTVENTKDLMEICAAVGLLQNFAALRGLQRGFTTGTKRLHDSKKKMASD